MSILIMEEHIFPSAEGYKPVRVLHHKPIVDSIRTLKDNCFKFEYAVDTVMQKEDFDSLSQETFDEHFDEKRVVDLIKPYKVIILMGSRLCKKVLNKQLKDVRGIAQKVGDRIIIPIESAFYLYKNKKSCFNTFKLAYDYYKGHIVDKPFATYTVIKDEKDLPQLIDFAKQTGIFAFDFETTSLDYFNPDEHTTVLSLSFQPGHAFLIPMEHDESPFKDNMQPVVNMMKELMSLDNIIKIAHNLKFDWHWMTKHDVKIVPRFADTMVMAHILNENRRHGLKELTKTYFPYWAGYDKDIDYNGPLKPLLQYAAIDTDITLRLYYLFERELLSQGNEKLYLLSRNMTTPVLQALQKIEYQGAKMDREYMQECSDKCKVLADKVEAIMDAMPEIQKFVIEKNRQLVVKDISRVVERLEAATTKAKESHDNKIAKLEQKIKDKEAKLDEKGVEYSADRYHPKWVQDLKELKKQEPTSSNVEKYKKELRELKTGQVTFFDKVNYRSPDQVPELLYDFFRFPIPKVRGELKRTSDRKYIKDFDHEFIVRLMEFRTINKMKSTYYDSMLEKLDDNDFIHGTFKVQGTVTGRLSSAGPNLQNIPSRLNFKSEDAEWALKQVKKCFINLGPDYVMMQADLSQAELRVIANYAPEETMKQAYRDGVDMHSKTGAQIKNMSLEDFMNLPKDEFKMARYHGKPANFGWVYKASVEGYQEFAKNTYGLVLTLEECEQHRDAMFKTYPDLAKWHARMERTARQQGFVETIFGRRRRLQYINNSTNQSRINKDIREAINAPIQGSSGEYTNFGIALLHHRLPPRSRMFCTVHDSVFFYLHKDELLLSLERINETFENPPLLNYFIIDPKLFDIPMQMDYELGTKSWRELTEIGNYAETRRTLEGDHADIF